VQHSGRIRIRDSHTSFRSIRYASIRTLYSELTTNLYLELEVELEVWLGVELGQQVHQTHRPGTGRLEHLPSHVNFAFNSHYNQAIIFTLQSTNQSLRKYTYKVYRLLS
jgi:hypothetical protein